MKRILTIALILMLGLGFALTISQVDHHSAFNQSTTHIVADVNDGSNNSTNGSGYGGGTNGAGYGGGTDGAGYGGGSDSTSQSNGNSNTAPTPTH